MDFVVEMITKFSKPPKLWNQPRSRKKKRWPLLRSSLSDYFCWTILYETRLPDAQDAKNWQRYARIAWEILRRNFIQSKLSTNWSPRKDQGATTGLLCVLQNGSPIFHSCLDTMLTQNTWCWWAGGVPWGHHFVGSNPHGCYHFVGVPIPFCRGGRLGTLHFGRPIPFKMVGPGPPINQILIDFCFFFPVGALHFVERDLFIHTQHHFIWEQDHMPVSGTSIL